LAYLTYDLVVAMTADAGIPLTSLKVDGGGARNNLLLQLLADALGVPVVRPQNVEATALGAILLAGLGAGIWSNADEFRNSWKIDRVFEPSTDATNRASAYADWQNAVSRAKSWAS
jgi:glycerol kinase